MEKHVTRSLACADLWPQSDTLRVFRAEFLEFKTGSGALSTLSICVTRRAAVPPPLPVRSSARPSSSSAAPPSCETTAGKGELQPCFNLPVPKVKLLFVDKKAGVNHLQAAALKEKWKRVRDWVSTKSGPVPEADSSCSFLLLPVSLQGFLKNSSITCLFTGGGTKHNIHYLLCERWLSIYTGFILPFVHLHHMCCFSCL